MLGWRRLSGNILLIVVLLVVCVIFTMNHNQKLIRIQKAVINNMALANKLGVTGVPGFIIGTVDRNDPRKITGISMIRGALPLGNFQKELDAALLR